jgi:hypothetical protein
MGFKNFKITSTTTSVQFQNFLDGWIDSGHSGWLQAKKGDWNVKLDSASPDSEVLKRQKDPQLDITSTITGSVHTTGTPC